VKKESKGQRLVYDFKFKCDCIKNTLSQFFFICTLSRDDLSQPCALGLKAGEVLITPIIAMPTLYDQERFCQQILYGVA
jgi:hypothetical protein